jgi:hypothetical protein
VVRELTWPAKFNEGPPEAEPMRADPHTGARTGSAHHFCHHRPERATVDRPTTA